MISTYQFMFLTWKLVWQSKLLDMFNLYEAV